MKKDIKPMLSYETPQLEMINLDAESSLMITSSGIFEEGIWDEEEEW